MKARRSLQELIQQAGITPVLARQPLPAPSQPLVIASQEDHDLARALLVEQRRRDPQFKDPNKELKRIFRSSKEKDRLQDPAQWAFSPEELDRALSEVIDKPTSSPGLIQAFLSLGAKVNYIETATEKKGKGPKQPNASARRRSTVLQRATTVRKADSVALLASSGADQTALNDALKAGLAANDQACIQELLRHGADVNNFPNALADAVRSNDQNLVSLLLRAPKAVRPDVVSSCLPAAVQAKSEQILSLLLGYGADPNFNGASALIMAISAREYRMAVALAAGPIRLTPLSLQESIAPCLRLGNAQELFQFLQLLLCCGLQSNDTELPRLLVTACKRNDEALARLLIENDVSTSESHTAEALKHTIAHANWCLVLAITRRRLSASLASEVLAMLSFTVPQLERLEIVRNLLHCGASGPSLGKWLTKAVEDNDAQLMDLLLKNGKPLQTGDGSALQLAVARKDNRTMRALLSTKPSPTTLSRAFPLLRQGYEPSERLDATRLLLNHGARGPEVNQALVDAIADTVPTRDVELISELVRHGADVNFNDGKSLHLAASRADISILRLLCKANPSLHSTSITLPLIFKPGGIRHPSSLAMLDLLLSNGVEAQSGKDAVRLAITGGIDNVDIVDRLLVANTQLMEYAFKQALSLNDLSLKIGMLNHLLSKNVQQENLDKALVTEVEQAIVTGNTEILKVLLDHGASVNHDGGAPLIRSVEILSPQVTRTLLHGRTEPSSKTATTAFRACFEAGNARGHIRDEEVRIQICRELLLFEMKQSAIDLALRAVLDDTNQSENVGPMLDILLDHNANVNTADGIAFVYAARRNEFLAFQKLIVRKPNFRIIVPTLLVSKLEEDNLVKALQICFDHGLDSECLDGRVNTIPNDPPLVLALRHYPRSESLIKLLLDHGCNPDVTASAIIDDTTGQEVVPVLTWGLAQEQKAISSSVLVALLAAGSSPTRATPVSELTPIAIAAREGRQDVVNELLKHGADPSVRDKRNRSALFLASSSPVPPMIEMLSATALKDDGSLQEAARCLHYEVAKILVKHKHSPNFPSRLHGGRNALGELLLHANVTNGSTRTKARQLIRLFLDAGANARFRARNDRSAVVLALDNAIDPLEVTEALLETEVWETLNDEKHMYQDERGYCYSPLKYIELVKAPSRSQHQAQLLELLRDKGCEPKYYLDGPEQPPGAIGLPTSIATLAARQKEHQLSLQLAKEANEHARMLDESNHRDLLRRKQEQLDADLAASASASAQWKANEQAKHDFEVSRVRSAERMKRQEKVAWHNLQMEQERDSAAQRQQIDDRKASATYAHEQKLIGARKSEIEHRAGLERKALMEKEQLFERNIKRQKEITERIDESAAHHARLRMERPAIEAAKWGSVD